MELAKEIARKRLEKLETEKEKLENPEGLENQ